MYGKLALTRLGSLAALATLALGPVASASPPSGSPPEGAPPRGRHRPPPFAYEACEGGSAGATCSVEHPDGSVQGTCVADENDVLFCRPDRMPPPPPR